MDWDRIRTGEDLHELAKTTFAGRPGPCVLMVDEAQEIAGWERAIASILKSNMADIYVTGSNARVFSTELSDRLSGRHVEIPVHPLIYPEFLEFSGEKDSPEVFGRFLRQGGRAGCGTRSSATGRRTSASNWKPQFRQDHEGVRWQNIRDFLLTF